MSIAVRYYSKSGSTKKIADAIAKGAGVEAASITEQPKLEDKVDVLFLGGAPYANIMAPELKAYAQSLSADTVDTVVLFSTSNWSKRTILALKKTIKSRGIKVCDESFYAQVTKVDERVPEAEEFGKKFVK